MPASLPSSLPACQATLHRPKVCLNPALLLPSLPLQASAERKRPAPSASRRLSDEAEEVLLLGSCLGSGLSLGSDGSGSDSEERQQDGAQQHDGVQQGQRQQGREEQGSQPATPLPKRPASAAAGEAPASAKAMGAVLELVQCCVGAMPLPPDPGAPRLPRPTAVRWYDARARVALLQVAAWLQVRGLGSQLRGAGGAEGTAGLGGCCMGQRRLLTVLCRLACSAQVSARRHNPSTVPPCLLACLPQVPARKVSNLELLLTQDKAPRQKSLSTVDEDDWGRRMRYLKVLQGGGARLGVVHGWQAGQGRQAGQVWARQAGRQLARASWSLPVAVLPKPLLVARCCCCCRWALRRWAAARCLR